MHDNDPLKCPSCGRRMEHDGWKTRAGTTEQDWDHYEASFHACDHCKLWWVDKLDGTPLTPVTLSGMKHVVGGKKRKR